MSHQLHVNLAASELCGGRLNRIFRHDDVPSPLEEADQVTGVFDGVEAPVGRDLPPSGRIVLRGRDEAHEAIVSLVGSHAAALRRPLPLTALWFLRQRSGHV